jgi:S-adenosylmethionine decarboxylase
MTGNAIGEHWLADLFGVTPERLADADMLAELLKEAAERSGLHAITAPTIVSFNAIAPGGQAGVTGFIVLAESHIAFHSYPELGFLAVDVFTCGANADPRAAVNVFVERLAPERVVMQEARRG